MKIKTIVIAPESQAQEKEIKAIINGETKALKTFCNQRNTVYLVNNGNEQWTVKKFKRPTIANCFIYTLFRPSKAKRAFNYAYKLIEKGIATAQPIAYAEESKNGFFHTGWYISRYLPLPSLNDIENLDETERQKLLTDLARFTAAMHSQGIIDYDYNTSNIFWEKQADGHYLFTLIDINRMRFGSKKLINCAIAMTTNALLMEFVEQYCEIRGIDKHKFMELVKLGYKRIHSRSNVLKCLNNAIKPFTKHKTK